MTYPWVRQPLATQAFHSLPVHISPLATPAKQAFPQGGDMVAKFPQRQAIKGHSIILVMPPQHRRQPLALLGDGHVHPAAQFLLDRLQLGPYPLVHRLPFDHKLPFAGRAAQMREPQKVEGLRLAFSPPGSVGRRKAAKLDQPGFLGPQFQVELLQPLGQFLLELLGFGTMLKAHHMPVR